MRQKEEYNFSPAQNPAVSEKFAVNAYWTFTRKEEFLSISLMTNAWGNKNVTRRQNRFRKWVRAVPVTIKTHAWIPFCVRIMKNVTSFLVFYTFMDILKNKCKVVNTVGHLVQYTSDLFWVVFNVSFLSLTTTYCTLTIRHYFIKLMTSVLLLSVYRPTKQ